MRTSTLVSAAFAGAAFASPLVKRAQAAAEEDVYTVYDVVSYTSFVTLTATAEAPGETTVVVPATTSVAPAETTSEAPAAPQVNQNWHKEQKWSWAWTSTYEVPATTEASTEAAPEPTTSEVPVVESTTQAAYAVPTSTSVYVASSSAAETSSTAEAAPAKATNYQQKVIVHHNVHRANHSASELTWSASLAATAQKIGESCNYAHNVEMDGGGYGQNIAAGVKPDDVSEVITDLFYNGEVAAYDGLYGQANPDMTNFHVWGHFSQIVWKKTTEVGCATVDCSSGGLANTGSYVSPYFTVCNYKSPGNYGGEYADNIGKSLGRASVDSTYGL